MTDELKQQMADDIATAKAMSEVTSAEGVLQLNTRLASYKEMVMVAIADYEHNAALLKAKKSTLDTFLQIGKLRQKELSILEYNASK